MYKVILIFILLTPFFNTAIAQANNQGAGVQLANRIADKLRDSLSLTSAQRDQLFSINMELHNRKMAARSGSQNRDSIGVLLQRIENKRDSLYGTILSEQQLLLYRQKKRYLINSQ
jgi:hypothetical protein